ncbi:hypothetical protein BaRGS_00039186 [Batillaria attramentaria]|uniref:Uncharacterized protein n=1 Tax=Batillaria attramentaria TaxID=370345 RepID=A0ABD0J421_9CAEN
MKRIKTDWRASLNNDSLNSLMCITLESPNIAEFNPEKAVELWMASGSRRKRLHHGQQAKKTTKSAAEGKEREMEEDEIREMSQSEGDEGGRQEEGEKDREVEEGDDEDEDAHEEELSLLESLSAGLDDDDFAGLKKADPSCFRFFNIEEDDDDDLALGRL